MPLSDIPIVINAGAEAAQAERGPALDPQAVATLGEIFDCGRVQAIAQVGGLFLQTAKPLLLEMRSAIGRSDALFVTRGAHTLKSSSGNAAALRLAALCADLERVSRSGELAEAEKALADVDAEFARVQAEIEEAIAEAGVPPLS